MKRMFRKKIIILSGIFFCAAVFLFADAAAAWYDNNIQYRRLITVDKSKVAVPSSETIIDNGDIETSSFGTWTSVSGSGGFEGDYLYNWNTGPSSWYSWKYDFSGQTKTLQISQWWTYHISRATDITIEFIDANGVVATINNQDQDDQAMEEQWNILGTQTFQDFAEVKMYGVVNPSAVVTPTIEAESGTITGPMETGIEGAIGYIHTTVTNTSNPSGSAVYNISIPEDGYYKVVGNVYGIGSTDSFYLTFDGVVPSGNAYAWDFPFNGVWGIDERNGGNGLGNDPLLANLNAGIHTMNIWGREKLAKIDNFYLAKVTSGEPPSICADAVKFTETTGLTTLTDFPMLVNIKSSDLEAADLRHIDNGGKVKKQNGGDIVFVASNDTTKLDHEIEKYDPATGELVAWVKIPTLSSEADTKLYIYYGGDVVDQWNPADVWDSDYKGIWHLKEDKAGTENYGLYRDSTSNEVHINDFVSSTGKVGQINSGQGFQNNGGNGNDDFMYAYEGWDYFALKARNYTWEAWFKASDTSSSKYIFDRWSGSVGYYCRVESDGDLDCMHYGDDVLDLFYDSENYEDGKWHHLVMTANQNTQTGCLYVDGEEKVCDLFSGLNDAGSGNLSLFIGNSNDGYSSKSFSGFLDEIRLSYSARSLGWIKTQFANQSAPETFYSLANEEDNGPPPESPPARDNGFPSGTASNPWYMPNSVSLSTAVLSLETGEKAVCRYSTVLGTEFDSMTENFLSLQGTSEYVYAHYARDVLVNKSGANTFYVRCKDEAGNVNTNDYVISFVASPIASGGLWGHYSAVIDTEPDGDIDYRDFEKSTYKNSDVENIDFANFTARKLEIATTVNAEVKRDGIIFAEIAGEYYFEYERGVKNDADVEIDGQYIAWEADEVNGVHRYGRQSISLEAGWHEVSMSMRSPLETDTVERLFWTPPGKSSLEIVPKEYLGYRNWHDSKNSTVSIPMRTLDGYNNLNGKQKVNFIVAGAGTQDENNPEIEINFSDYNCPLCDHPNLSIINVFKGDVYLVASYEEELGLNNIAVTNLLTGESANLIEFKAVKKRFTNGSGFQFIGRVPPQLISGGGEEKLRLRFSGVDGRGGIGLIVPYEDEKIQEKGRIMFQINPSDGYHKSTSALVFPVRESNEPPVSAIAPFFMINDGETKVVGLSDAEARPNYVVALSGSGVAPDDTAILKNMTGAKRVIPEGGPIVVGNPLTWYMSYGREGPQFDVVSPNYVRNIFNVNRGLYGATSQEGKISNIYFGTEDTWIAYQYYGSNLDPSIPGINVDGITGDGESGTLIGGGMFSTVGPDFIEINVCSGECDSSAKKITDFTLNVGGEKEVYACYVESDVANTCYGKDISNDSETTWTYISDAETYINITKKSPAIVKGIEVTPDLYPAKFEVRNNLLSSDDIEVTVVGNAGVCGLANKQVFCATPSVGLCSGGSLATELVLDGTGTGWTWKCGNINCSATKSCTANNYKEVAP